jgi:hypothetical protein
MAPHDDDEGAAVAVPDTGEQGESGKLKMIVSLVKKVVGVKDIASMFVCPHACKNRVSLQCIRYE